ncbi:MAG TPA: cytochrome P450 [Solirubrobacteraceae bacterium]|nr:cytochrome P450 [Solirubrobacteraceae bacterium]
MTHTKNAFPLGAMVTLDQLENDPHPILASLRKHEPVSWLPALHGWLVTRHDLAMAVMRDASTFTVDDPRFSTGQVVGPSMLSLDGADHARHRAPFSPPFRPTAVKQRFADAAAAEANSLIDGFAATGHAELRREFAGPLAASIMARALGLAQDEVTPMLDWYDGIVAAVTEITAGHTVPASGRDAFAALRTRLNAVIADESELLGAAATHSDLTHDQVVSNAAILLFGGIETTEGMITNALLYLLENEDPAATTDPSHLDAVIDESLRLEPAAAVIDRYATTDATLADAHIDEGDLVRVSITAANRDPAIFEHPDQYIPGRPRARRHLAFAQGPHVCLGIHLARLEARAGLTALTTRLPNLRLDPDHPSSVTGLVFRKPPTLHARWDKG